MKPIFYLMTCLCLTACSHWPFKFFRQSPAKQTPEIFKEPKIYIGQQNKWINISELNRSDFTLGLSDKILFSNQTFDELSPQTSLESLKNLNTEKSSLKVTVYSSCFHKETDKKSIWEAGSESYLLAFSILELLPNEMLTGNLDDVFYCSFIFSITTPEETTNYYNITQQSINPFLGLRNSQGKITLFIETEDQSIPVGKDNVIKENNAHKVTLINTGNTETHSYHLSCEGIKMQTFPGPFLNRVQLYGNLITWDYINSQKGVKKCRVFAKNKHNNITGMTNSFYVDFDGLNKAFLKTTPSEPPFLKEPKIYISQHNQWINSSDLNKSQVTLNLSDKIAFSNHLHQESTPQNGLKDLGNLSLNKPSLLKTKVHSSCSYKEAGKKFVWDAGSESYLLSFSILELLPEEIFMDKLDTTFNCSFLFSFINSKGHMNHRYDIMQQSIDPALNYSHNQLSLIKTTTNQSLMNNATLQADDIHNSVIVNTTDIAVYSYHLFCDGREIQTFSDPSLNTIPLYGNLIKWNQENPEKSIKKCRIFAKNDKLHIIGMTDFFHVDFDDLNHQILKAQTKTIDFQTVQMNLFRTPDINYKINPGNHAPLNSHFSFKNIDALSHHRESIKVTVTTECINSKLFGTEHIASHTYHFSFRGRFPIMAVTPKEAFLMGHRNYNDWKKAKTAFLSYQYNPDFQSFSLPNRTKDHYTNSCTYAVTLTNKNDTDNKKEFKKRHYFLKWNSESYGVDYKPKDSHKLVTPIVDYSQLSMITRKTFLKLTDIKANRDGTLQLDFFDITQSYFSTPKEHKIDSIILECHCHMIDKSYEIKLPQISPLLISWPYNSRDFHSFISLKTLFSHPEAQQYFRRNTLAVCRVLFYEKEILKYFSGEMKITQ